MHFTMKPCFNGGGGDAMKQMTKTQRQLLNAASEEKFDIGQRIIRAACKKKQADPRAQALVDRYLALDAKVRGVLDTIGR